MLHFSKIEFWIVIGLKFSNEDEADVYVDSKDDSFIKKDFSKHSSIAYLEHLVDYIVKTAPRSRNLKKKSLKRKKSDESSLSKQKSLSNFDFVEVDVDNDVMICLLCF